MPRRYSDYPDVYKLWNMVSSVGSLLSVVSVLMFFLIIWEALLTGRVIVYSMSLGSSLEWVHPTPPADHSYDEVPVSSF